MAKTLRCGAWVAGMACALAAVPGRGEDIVVPGPRPLCLDELARMSWVEMECLYRAAEAGAIPTGTTRGLAFYSPCDKHAALRSRTTKLLWKGKEFDCAGTSLVNRWCGLKAIKAQVYYGPSWLDGKPSIIMDYACTSHVWKDVRDEVREIAPGLYLGLMYHRKPCGAQMKLFFALDACCR